MLSGVSSGSVQPRRPLSPADVDSFCLSVQRPWVSLSLGSQAVTLQAALKALTPARQGLGSQLPERLLSARSFDVLYVNGGKHRTSAAT